jgi:hypothetical protein
VTKQKREEKPLKSWASMNGPSAREVWGIGIAVFAVALIVRILFLQATPDSSWPYSSYYRGDSLTWLQYADAIQKGAAFQDGLPLRPPGMAFLVAGLWNGKLNGIETLNILWCVLGSVAVALFYVAVLRSFGSFAARLAGLAAACSTALLLLSTSLNNEVPYLVLVVAGFCLHERLREKPLSWTLVTWSVLHSLACLIRVEHALFYLLVLGFFCTVWMRTSITEGSRSRAQHGSGTQQGSEGQPGFGTQHGSPAPGRWKLALAATSLSLLFFVLPLVPWQIHAGMKIEKFNMVVRPSDEALTPEARRAEELIRSMAWDREAETAGRELPGFLRRLATDFVAATVQHRGRQLVRAGDFRILEDAFGYRPESLNPFPFVTSYGPLNFHLANNEHATGGFNRFALDDPPPLKGGASNYYPDLLLDPPGPGMFFLDWPPHLRAFNHGYEMGWKWIRQNPGRYATLAAEKLRISWSGASLGFTGYNFPLGLSGLQRSVDLVVPSAGGLVTVWRVLVLIVCTGGIIVGRKRWALYPWLLFALSKIVVVAMFFGYARIGATVAPLVILLGALVADSLVADWKPGPRQTSRSKGASRHGRLVALGIVLALILLGEVVRAAIGPRIFIDNQEVQATDPFPGLVHRDREVEVRFQ